VLWNVLFLIYTHTYVDHSGSQKKMSENTALVIFINKISLIQVLHTKRNKSSVIIISKSKKWDDEPSDLVSKHW
jgi:hypothetical protein